MRIAAVQDKAAGNIDENIRKAAYWIRESRRNNADIVLFPECYLTSYSFPPKLLRPGDIHTVSKVAEEENISVLMTGFTGICGNVYDDAYLISRKGDVLYRYSKVHTCAFSDERVLSRGSNFFTAEIAGVMVGTMICYDREYP